MAASSSNESYPLFSLASSSLFGGAPEKPLPPPPPCVEVHPREESAAGVAKSSQEPITINEGLTLLKGRVSTLDVLGVSNSDLVPGKYEGGLKLWEGSIDLVRTLYSEVREGRLSLRGKHVLELGCGHGLPGIFTCLEGAAAIHFQDFNAEVLQSLTIPNVEANLSKQLSQEKHLLLKKDSEVKIHPQVHFFAGGWGEIHQLLLHQSHAEHPKEPGLCSTRERFQGYDIILMAETVYAISSLPILYGLIKKCLRRPFGVVYMAGKKHYFGVGGGTRQFCHIVEEDDSMEACLLAEVANGSSNVREVWKFTFK